MSSPHITRMFGCLVLVATCVLLAVRPRNAGVERRSMSWRARGGKPRTTGTRLRKSTASPLQSRAERGLSAFHVGALQRVAPGDTAEPGELRARAHLHAEVECGGKAACMVRELARRTALLHHRQRIGVLAEGI